MLIVNRHGISNFYMNRQDAKAPRLFEPPRRQGFLNRKGAEAQRKHNTKDSNKLRNLLFTTPLLRTSEPSALNSMDSGLCRNDASKLFGFLISFLCASAPLRFKNNSWRSWRIGGSNSLGVLGVLAVRQKIFSALRSDHHQHDPQA